MSHGYGALCSDFYINQKLALRMDLTPDREALLGLFERIRKEHPALSRFRRYEDEISLESEDPDGRYAWVALRRASVRSGAVNPDSIDDAIALHRLVLETSPYFLSISPLEIDHLEVTYGFDLEAETNRNELVFDTFFANSPLAGLIDRDHEMIFDAQPFVGFALDPKLRLEAFVEIKARTRANELVSGQFQDEPISVLLTVRHHGKIGSLTDLVPVLELVNQHARQLADERVVPAVVMPIREAISSRPG